LRARRKSRGIFLQQLQDIPGQFGDAPQAVVEFGITNVTAGLLDGNDGTLGLRQCFQHLIGGVHAVAVGHPFGDAWVETVVQIAAEQRQPPENHCYR
jgi:hypothetical protein